MSGRFVVSAVAVAAALVLPPAAQAWTTGWLNSNTLQVAFDSAVTYDANGNPTYHPPVVGTDAAGNRSLHASLNDPTIWNQLAGMIRSADPGSAIGIAVYDSDPTSAVVLNALHDVVKTSVKNPPVQLWVVTDHNDPNFNGGWVQHYKNCSGSAADPHGGCLSNNTHSRQHSKYAVFSSTRNPKTGVSTKAAWVSSANLSSRTGQEEYNNALAFYGNQQTGANQMYDNLQKVFTDQWDPEIEAPEENGLEDSGDYFDRYHLPNPIGYFETTDSNAVGYVSPEHETNLWYEALRDVDVVPGCTVRVSQAEWGDGLITTSSPNSANPAQALADLYRAGCNVAVIVHQKDSGNSILDEPESNDTRRTLCSAGVPVRTIPLMHDKLAIAGPSYSGNASNWQVMTGSHNMSKNALRVNDELLVRMRYSKPLFDLYHTHWWEQWAYAANVCNALPTG